MRIIYLFAFCLAFTAPTSASIGDRPIDWSKLESADFRDYAIRHFNRQGSIVNNYWLHFWLNQKLVELNFVSPGPLEATIPIVLKDSSINAFAIPGNIIGIHSGLWFAAESEGEFISVLAHEMAHISLDHFSRLRDNAQNQTWTLAGGILLTLLFSQENPELANAALLSTIASTQQNQLNFSRSMELEADQMAQQILSNSNYDPEAGRVFFQKLQDQSTGTAYEFLRTHPLGSTRSSNLSSSSSPKEASNNNELFNVLKAQLNNAINTEQFQRSDLTVGANEQFAMALLKQQETKDLQVFKQELTELTLRHPQFLPAHAELLGLLSQSDDSDLCEYFSRTSKLFEDEFLTLDVLEDLKLAAEQCQHGSAELWHTNLLWYSGKEERALAYLNQSLRQEVNENKAARLKALLGTLTSRYERFR